MATIETTIDRAAGLTVQTVVGAATANELIAAIETYFQGEPTRLILWDFREADLTDIEATDIQEAIRVTRRYADRRPGGRTAIVASSDLAFGLGRMFESRQQFTEPTTVSHATFRSMERARAWLAAEE